MHIGFGIVCLLVGSMTMTTVPLGSIESYLCGILGMVGGYCVFIGLVIGEI